jgi:hypothetical protein
MRKACISPKTIQEIFDKGPPVVCGYTTTVCLQEALQHAGEILPPDPKKKYPAKVKIPESRNWTLIGFSILETVALLGLVSYLIWKN